MNGRESNAALTAKVADLERRLQAVERFAGIGAPDTRVSDAVRERERGYVCPQCGPAPEGPDVHAERMHMWPPVDPLGRRDVMGSQHAAGQ